MSRKTLLFGGLVTAVVVVAIGIGWLTFGRDDHGPAAVAGDLARALTTEKFDGVTFAGTSSDDVAKQYQAVVSGLGPHQLQVEADVREHDDTTATVDLHMHWHVGGAEWSYDSVAELLQVSDPASSSGHKQWKPKWDVGLVDQELHDGDKLTLSRTAPRRGDILGAGGATLVTTRDVVTVGIEPRRATNLDESVHQVAQLTGVDEGDLKSRAHAAKPDAFVEVVTLRDTDYQAQKAKLQPIPGTVFRAGQLPLAPTRGFASALLGRAGPVTAEIVDKSAGRYVAGDTAGLSGLQQQYDTQLSGTPGVAVRIVASDGTVEKTFDIVDAKNGSNIATTIDPRVQSAAETAISGVDKQTSLVAVNVRTRDVLAVANGPDVGGLDRALTGQYPPGSSFKVVSAYALESAGLKSTDTVSCPPSVTVDGRVFANAEKESFGDIPFHTDFARSCNTAFVNASSRLGKSSLAEAAASFGVGTPWSMGVPVFPGSVPQSDDKVERSADVIGQGKVLVSPLAMANVSAVAASGTNQAPRLVTDPAPSGSNPIGTNLDPALVASLQSMMREVVTEGTGTAAARVPGAPVFGKTGTAEFGTDNPPRTHAWFVGYQNDVAFAVLVEDGGFGGDVAAPIAAKFLTALGS